MIDVIGDMKLAMAVLFVLMLWTAFIVGLRIGDLEERLAQVAQANLEVAARSEARDLLLAERLNEVAGLLLQLDAQCVRREWQ